MHSVLADVKIYLLELFDIRARDTKFSVTYEDWIKFLSKKRDGYDMPTSKSWDKPVEDGRYVIVKESKYFINLAPKL